MQTKHRKPQLEIPEEEHLEHFAPDDAGQGQPKPEPSKVWVANEADWIEQQVEVPIEDEEAYS